MTTITTRAGKGSPLTHAELDANFTNLNANKLEESGGQLQIAGKFVPTANGTQDHGTSVLRWGTSWVQQVDATISSNAVASISMTNSNTGNTADARLLANSATQVIGLVMRSDAHTTNLVSGAGDAILYTSSTRLRMQWNGNMRAHGVGTDWVVGVGEGASTASSGGVRAPDIVGTNQPGAALTLRPGLSTGSGVGGSLILQSGTTGTTGTAQNAATTRITLSPTDTAFAGAVSADTSVWNIGSGQIYKDASGNVGLGTTSPGAPIHIQKTFAGALLTSIENLSNSAAANTRYLLKNDSAATAGLQFWSSGAAAPNLLTIYNSAAAALAFATNAVERGRFTSTGEFVVGNNETSATPTAGVFRGTDASGTDVAGANITLRPGRGTGSGAPGTGFLSASSAGSTGTALQTAANVAQWSAAGLTVIGSAAALGYATGSGGTVTQATSKATGVTLNKGSGQITTAADALAAGASVAFTLTNSLIAAADHIRVQRQSGGTAGAYEVWCDSVAAGSCVIYIRNRTAGSLSEAVVLTFQLSKGATA